MSTNYAPGSTSQHNFARIPTANIPRSTFDRSSQHKTTFDSGLLIPIFRDEALPGDTFNLRMSTFARLATPLFPVMDNMTLTSHFFAVPLRLLWDNFQKFNGEQTDPADSTSFTIPTLTSTGGAAEQFSPSDYLGIPPAAPGLVHSALYHRAYNLIYNEWFRDENLQDSVVVDTDDGPDTYTDYDTIHRRGKRHDYFTSCLPWPQKGDAVELPLGTVAPVVATGTNIPTFSMDGTGTELNLRPTSNTAEAYLSVANEGVNPLHWKTTSLEADLSAATAATINQLRQSFAIQSLYERDARGGSRYTEIVRSHFGVVSPDARLQRPEYLGGGTQQINISAVPNTSGASSGVIGDLHAYGTSSGSNHTFTKSFTEHCIIIGLVSVSADLTYQQGLERLFSRSTRWDYFWPDLANVGEMAVLNKEIYAQGTDDLTADAAVFGYQEAWADYRYKPSQVSGRFRSAVSGSQLDTWHLSQDFSALPTLGSTFIEDNPPFQRIVAVQNEPEFLFDAFFKLTCARPLPTFSVPGQIGRF